ncbi:putative ribosome-binding factor A, mitochondrial [Candoia aspera]|uniref:putative ribosome-binding factor A, mitochondrial n=1 Tax=Candoia aspera TaxID=51853 RepID=UPI002FD83A5F
MWSVRNGLAAAATSVGKRASLPWQGQRLPALGGLSVMTCPSCCQALHCSRRLCRSTSQLLKKFLVKKKKKFWYSSPTLGSQMLSKPSSLTNALKLTPPKIRKQDSIRKKTLNVLLFHAVRDLLSTPDAGQELYDLNVELFKASLTSDFSTCHIYWKSSGNAEQDERIQKVLQRKASYIRHLLISYRVRVNVPSIVFVKDKGEDAVREIEKLLAIADMGPEEEENKLIQNDFSQERSTVADTPMDAIPTNLFGIDHKALNKQIIEYKKMKKDEPWEGTSMLELQLAEIRQHQKKMKWKKARKIYDDDDLNPEEYLMDRYSKENWDSDVLSSENEELEYKPKEDGNELEKEK